MKSFVLALSLTLSLTACGGGGGESPDIQENIPAINGDADLDRYVKFATDYQGLPYIRASYANLNKDDKAGYVILGTFYGMTPNESSYIYFDESLKTADYAVIINDKVMNMTDERLKVWTAGHEVCHWGQWRDGMRFDQQNLEHDARSYEIACNLWGDNVLQYWDSLQGVKP